MKKAIWLIAGGPMQWTIAKKIKEQGYRLILSDGSPTAFCKSLADVFFQIDTFDIEKHFQSIESLPPDLTVVGVVTMGADCHGTVSELAKKLKLHHLDPEISKICRDKHQTRKVLQAAGLRQPQSHLVSTHEQAQALLRQSQSPFVLKATDNSGSRGFLAIDQAKGLSKEQFDYTVSMGTTGQAILEEKLVADPEQVSEASVETVWFNGHMYWLNWVDRIFPRDLKFFPQLEYVQTGEGIEVGHINPATHDFSVKQEVARSMQVAGKALGMDRQKGGHILKGDIFFSTNGPVLLEVTPRSSGGWDSSGSSVARGANIAGGLIHLALGHDLDLETWFKYFAFQDAERTAIVVSSIPDQAKDCTGRQFAIDSGYLSIPEIMQKALMRLKKGDYIVPVC